MPMPFSPCDPSATTCTDQSIGIIRHIFGPIIDTLVTGGDPNSVQASANVLATMFSFFNSGILIVGSLIVSYVALMGVANTANDGEAMGKSWSSVWTPIRIVAGGSVLLPTTSGYSFIQIVILMFGLWGVGFGNGVYRAGLTMGILSPNGIVQGVNQPGSFYGMRDFARQYLEAAYCAKAANAIYAASTADGAAGNTSASASPQVKSQPSTWDQQIVSGGSTDNVFYVMDRNTSTNLAGGEPFCGTINITQYKAQTAGITDPIVLATEQLHAQAQAQKVAAVTAMMAAIDQWVATWPNTIDDDGWNNVNSNQFNTIITTAENQVATSLSNSVTSGQGGVDGGITSFADSLTSDGWASAGGWFQRVGMVRGQIASVLASPVGTVTEPSLASLPPDSRAARLTNSVTTVTEIINKKAEQKPSFGASAVKPDDIASLIPKDPKSDINPGALKAAMDAKMGSFINNTMHNIVDMATGAGSNGQTPLCGTAGQMGGSLNRMKCIGDYLTVARTGLIAADFTIKSAATAMRVVAGTLSSVKGVGTGLDLDKVATPLWDWIIEVPSKQIAMLMTYMEPLAFYFGIVLPSLPYTLYMVVVVGWILALLQSVIAGSLWAVMHMTPDRTFIGSQSQGYLLLLSLFARPALAVIGLFAAILVSDPIIDFIANGFFAIRGAVVTSTGGVGWLAEWFTFAQWLQMFGIVLLPVLYMVYGLPQYLPDHVLRWVGAGISDLGETGAMSEMRGGLARVGAGAGAGGGGPRRLGGGGGSQGRLPGGGSGGSGGGGSGGASGGGGGGFGSKSIVSANSQGVVGSAPAGGGGGSGGRQGMAAQGGSRDTRRMGEKLGEGFGMTVGRGATLGAAAVGRSAARFGSALVSGGGRGALAEAAQGSKQDVANAMRQAGRDGNAAFQSGADGRLGAIQRSKSIQNAARNSAAVNGGTGTAAGTGSAAGAAGAAAGGMAGAAAAAAAGAAGGGSGSGSSSKAGGGTAPMAGSSRSGGGSQGSGGSSTAGADLVGGGRSSVAGARGGRSSGSRPPSNAGTSSAGAGSAGSGSAGAGGDVVNAGRSSGPASQAAQTNGGSAAGNAAAAPAPMTGSARSGDVGQAASRSGGSAASSAPAPLGEAARPAPAARPAGGAGDGSTTISAGRQAQPSASPPPTVAR